MTEAGVPSALTISVVIPVLHVRFLGEALDSVASQDYRPIEIVVIDSSDGSARRVIERHAPLVRHERQPPAGIATARNRGVELASGELLAFLDADDLFEPGRLRLQASELAADPSLEAVFGRATEFIQPGLSEGERAALRQPRTAVESHLVWAMLIRRSAFDRIGPFTTDYVVGETVDWYARAQSMGLRSTMLDSVVARRRLHGANTGIRRWDARQELVRVARAAVQRRRAMPPGAGGEADPA
jgi:glycosyltransferase involved in cell wall biosynthesis